MESGLTWPCQADSEKPCAESVLFTSPEAFMVFLSQILRLFLWRLEKKMAGLVWPVPSHMAYSLQPCESISGSKKIVQKKMENRKEKKRL